ncbi:MAG TPA: tetratricopeptide repeat protein [Vicinamibacteria bacterium]
MKTRVLWMGALTLSVVLAAAEARAQRGIAQGKVVDESGQGVAEAAVSFEFQGGLERRYETKTDKKGRYTQIVAPGPYRVTATKEGYQGAFLDRLIDAGAPTAVPDLQVTSQETAIAAAIEKDAVLGPLKKAMELTKAGKLDEAEAVYKDVLARDPSIAEAHYNLGSIYLGRKDLARAEAEFQKVVELRPQSEQAYGALSRVHEQKGDPGRAIEVMEKGVAAKPEDPVMQFDLGVLYFNARRTEEAERTFRKVEALDPQNPRVHYLLATLALNRGDVPEATGRLETYLARAPADAPDRATAKGLLEQLKGAAKPAP